MKDINKLVSSAKDGCQKAFNKLYELTRKDVWFTCLSLIKHEENAKDVFQDTYITAFMKINTLKNNENFTAWIKRIAVNKCKDFFKSKVEYQLDEDVLNEFVETDELAIPEEYITKSEKRKIILQIIEDNLSYVQYQCVIMYYYDNMSVTEIAQILECPEGTIMSRLNLARAKMKKAITDYENKNGDRLHSVVFLPLFSSIFKAQSNDIKVPKIKITFPTETGKITLTKGAETVIKGTGKGILTTMKSKVIATVCLLAVVSGGSTAIAMFAGCGENQQPSVTETTMNTEVNTTTTTPTLNDTDQAIIDAGLKVDDKGNIVDENGKKVEVSEDGKVEIKTEDGKTIKVDVDKVSEANTNNEKIKNSSSNTTPTTKPSATKATEKATEKATQATTKATEPKVTEKVTQPTTKATQPTTKATQPTTKATQPATQKPTQKPTEAPTEAPTQSQWKSRIICNDCNADLTDLYHNDPNAFDDHLYNHIMEGGYGSYRVLNF